MSFLTEDFGAAGRVELRDDDGCLVYRGPCRFSGMGIRDGAALLVALPAQPGAEAPDSHRSETETSDA